MSDTNPKFYGQEDLLFISSDSLKLICARSTINLIKEIGKSYIRKLELIEPKERKMTMSKKYTLQRQIQPPSKNINTKINARKFAFI